MIDLKLTEENLEEGCRSCGKPWIRHLGVEGTCKLLQNELKDWAATDTRVRSLCKLVLSEKEVDGDSYGVPMVDDLVELLVGIIIDQKAEIKDFKDMITNLGSKNYD